MDACIAEVDPNDPQAIRNAVDRLRATPPDAAACKRAVAHLKWEAVGRQLLGCYERVLRGRKLSELTHASVTT